MITASRRRAAAVALAGAFAAAVAALAVPAAAQTPDNRRVVRAQGQASREVTPDMATISIGVTSTAKDASGAVDASSAAAAKIIATAKSAGIEARDIRTSTLNLSEQMRNKRDSSGMVSQEPDGYVATNTVNVRVRDLSRLGNLLRTVVGDGANRINNLTFGFSEREKAEAELRVEAVANARQMAEQLAQAAGAKLGPIVSISYPPRGGARPMEFGAVRAMAKSDMPIEAGALAISADVETVWTIE